MDTEYTVQKIEQLKYLNYRGVVSQQRALRVSLRVDGVGTAIFGVLVLAGPGIAFMLAGAAWVATFAILVGVLLRQAEGGR
jgi:hypothetical protein